MKLIKSLGSILFIDVDIPYPAGLMGNYMWM